MSSAENKAVFLSYASQDAEAAKRLAEALRAAGVEVWLDAEGGLEHGDEWDAKIRRQIKECVLFIPIISANTQAREEGYFRLEWDLAAERARTIASGVAFILPVVIDDTKEPAALVPDRFRSVQWTRLKDGEITPEVKARFLKLWSHRAGVLKEAASAGRDRPIPPGAKAGSGGPALQPKRLLVWPWAALGLVAVVAAYLMLKPRRSPEEVARIGADAQKLATAAGFPRDPELRRARALLFTTEAIMEDFLLAEDIIKPVVAQRPNDPEVATVAAEISLEFLVRGFDLTPARRALAQRQTERAVQLAPGNPYALVALGRYLRFINAQPTRAEELVRRAITIRPDDARFHRALFSILVDTKGPAELDAYGERMAEQFPGDPLVTYDIARRFKDENKLALAEKWFDATLAHQSPPAFAYVWKAWLACWVHGDLAAMKHWLDRVPERQRANARVANARYLHALLSGDTGHAFRALNEVGEEWLTDFDFTGPKALLVGMLHQQVGRADLAKMQLEAALAVATAATDRSPTDLRSQRAKLWVLLGLGRMEEARAIYQILLQSTPRPYVLNFRSLGWTNLTTASLLLGRREDALALLRETCAEAGSRLVLRTMFKLDPRLAPWRDDAEITALLAEPVAAPSSLSLSPSTLSVADSKSVAVLAFANLSDDKANEYFSDGISEELLNVLAKVPGLKVSARTSAFYFKGKQVPMAEIARQLGVAYVVEGSVRKAGDKVRITAQLIKAVDGFHVWSDTFTRDLKDVFAVQDEIAGLIAQNLSLRLGVTASGPVVIFNPEAYRLYLEGRQAWTLRNTAGFSRARELFKAALALEPNFARALVGLADVREGTDATARAEERALVQRALSLEPSLSEAHATLGVIQESDWDFVAAEQSLRRAIELNPNNATAHQWWGRYLERRGLLEPALAALAHAAELDPLSPRILDNYASLLVGSGRFEEGLAVADRVLALQPGSMNGHRHRADALWHLGRRDEAVVEANWVVTHRFELTRNSARLACALAILRRAGHQAEVERIVRETPAPEPWDRFWLQLGAGQHAQALELTDEIEVDDLTLVLWHELFDPIRTEPRFTAFLNRRGLVEVHTRAQRSRADLGLVQ